MEQIINIIKELENTSSSNAKLDILRKNKDNGLLKNVLLYTYNPYRKYGITEKTIKPNCDKPLAYFDIFELLDILSTSNINDNLRYEVNNFLGNFQNDKDKFELYKRMILKDLKINMNAKSINKVFPNLIPSFNVMLADKYFDNENRVKGEFILTTKLDGNRIVAIKQSDTNVRFFSRQGQPIEGLVEIEEELKLLPSGYVYDGELLAVNTEGLSSKDLYRKTMQIGRKDGIKKGLQFHMFDIVTIGGFTKGIDKTPCSERKQLLHDILSKQELKHIIEVPILYQGTDKDMIIKFLNEAKSKDEEGVMMNVSSAHYECKRSKGILKVKVFNDADVRVINILEGGGKNTGKLGAITIQFEHEGKIHECNCGSGFNDLERIKYYENPELLLNKIVTIGYFEVSSNENGGYGLRFPTWKGIIREDKNEISMY